MAQQNMVGTSNMNGSKVEPPSPCGLPTPMSSTGFSGQTPDSSAGLRQRNASFSFDGESAERAFDFNITHSKEKKRFLWNLMSKHIPADKRTIQRSIVNHVEYTLARTRYNFDQFGAYLATAHSVRDRLIEGWNDTQQHFTTSDEKRVYYLSLEYLMGRSLQNSLLNLDLKDNYKDALMEFGFQLENLYEAEKDAALGNGGLGRLAACFVDSLATLDYPAWGYGLRYTYGMFEQHIQDGWQIEHPDFWLTHGNPWEIERLDVQYPVQFYGQVSQYTDEGGNLRFKWDGGEHVQAVAHDTPIPGFDTYNVINIRLWGSKPSAEFDLAAFNASDYMKAIDTRQRSENITSVLYPNDNTYMGKELRLKQQYLLASATLQDILRRFKKKKRDLAKDFPEKVAIQLNDTHPVIGIAELMRILLDVEYLDWDVAWGVVVKVYAYTNHTVLPEALEKWPVPLMEHLLPRHMQIIFEINHRFLQEVDRKWPGDVNMLSALSIIEEGSVKQVRMAHLGCVGSHSVNGVAALHSELLKTSIFKNFYELWPEKFNNKTNGVTPRRWLAACNPDLRDLITTWLESEEWIKHLDLLTGLRKHANNPDLQRQWLNVKQSNKEKLAALVESRVGIKVNTNALFDVQVKRIHEYKRQLLNILGVIHRYTSIKNMTAAEKKKVVPRVVFFGGKAAPGYFMAKKVIKLINAVAEEVNNDKDMSDLLKVVYIPNYNVSQAEVIIPASEISQHISTAGMEASGTSNMKFAMNGGLILGTMDGANIEIREEIGEDNMFIFGALAEDVETLRSQSRFGRLPVDPRWTAVLDTIRNGAFGSPDTFMDILDSLTIHGDYYLLGYDFPSYLDAQARIDETYKNQEQWAKMSILSTAGCGKFSTDRTMREYAKEIWNIHPCPRPKPVVRSNSQDNMAQAIDQANKLHEAKLQQEAAKAEPVNVVGPDIPKPQSPKKSGKKKGGRK